MQTHDLIQGTPDWHAHRRNHFNASDCAAMLGISPYKTRNQLLHEMHTGITPEVDVATQHLFDNGHRAEALARPLAEQIIGQELYPVTGTEGKLSASFDGITMDETIAFEHKLPNNDLRVAMVQGCTGTDLPLHYQAQLEQQCMVSNCERILFMASEWDADGELIEERHCWYTPNAGLSSRIAQGWTQFAIELENYEPPAAAAPAVVGRTPENLPALLIEVTGQVTASNIGAFKEHAIAMFKSVNRELVSDQQFADAAQTIKFCGDVETRLDAAKQHALSQTASIDELFRTIDAIKAEARKTRLDLEKLVEARKAELRLEIVQKAQKALSDHIEALNTRLGGQYMPEIKADFAEAIKGKRTVESLQNAADTTLANAKIEASATADRIQANLKTLADQAPDHAYLFPDAAQIVQKQADDLQALITARLLQHEQAQERKRMAQEQAQAAIVQAATPVAAPVPPQAAPSARRVAATQPATPPTLKLGQICERLGFTVTAEFLSALGINHAKQQGAAKLYHEADFAHVCAALVQHIQRVSQSAEALF